MSSKHKQLHEEEEEGEEEQKNNNNNDNEQQNQQQNDHIGINIEKELEKLKNEQEQQDLSSFECHICFDLCKEPVITPCGHMFCWVCIYKWLNQNTDFLQCPICKNGITQESLISVYTKEGQNEQDQQRDPTVPQRPIASRTQPVRNQNAIGEDGNFMNTGQNLQSGVMLAGYGYFPSLFNLQFQVQNNIDDSQEEHQSPEIDHQKIFTRIYYGSVGLFVLTVLSLV